MGRGRKTVLRFCAAALSASSLQSPGVEPLAGTNPQPGHKEPRHCDADGSSRTMKAHRQAGTRGRHHQRPIQGAD
jgi:hypothetical protein